MSSKAQKLVGKARLMKQFNYPWRGFTLQRGHFYGQTKSGLYFVSAYEGREQDDKIKVYLGSCNTYSNEYCWTVHWFDSDSELVDIIKKALPERKKAGIHGVELKPLERQKAGYNPPLTTTKYYPYQPMMIPGAGKRQYSHFVSEGSKA